MKKKRVAIVGGGIGGLGVGLLLAHRGYDVAVLEKNETLGGACNRFSEQGFIFDTGPSWYLMPEVYENFFRLVGERIEEHITLADIAPAQRYFFAGRAHPVDFVSDLKHDLPQFAALEQSRSTGVRHYLERAAARYEFISRYSLHDRMDSVFDYLPLLMRADAPSLGITYTLQREIERASESPEVQAILSVSGAFLGSWSWQTPALFSFLSHAQFAQGLKHPMGGMYKIIEALVALSKARGVQFRTGFDVRSVRFDESGVARLESVDGSVEADIVISDVDRSYTESTLLGRRPRSLRTPRHGFSALLLFLGVRSEVPEFAHHTFVFGEDWKRSARMVEGGRIEGTDPFFYVSHPSATDPSLAPAGQSTLFVLIPVPASASEEELDACAESVKARMSAHAPSLKGAISFERRWYPREFGERYRTLGNSALGLAHTFLQSGPFRPSHRDREHRNLYFVGATSNPGIGMPACLLSAEQVAAFVAEDNGSQT